MQLIRLYEYWIAWIVGHGPRPDKFVHTYAGLILWLVAAIVLRKSLRSRTPVVVVLVIELANECIDRVAHGSWMWPDTFGDVAATMFWPAVLTFAIASLPQLSR